MTITKHCYKNAKKRCGLNKNSFEKLVECAKEKRIGIWQTKGNLKKWIQSNTLKHKCVFSVWVYDKYLILYTNDTVISVYQIPNILPIDNFILRKV